MGGIILASLVVYYAMYFGSSYLLAHNYDAKTRDRS